MKTSFTNLFTLIAVAIALAGGLFSSPAQAQGLIGQLIHELVHDHSHDHHHGHSSRGHGGHSFNNGHRNGHNFNGGHSGHNSGHNFRPNYYRNNNQQQPIFSQPVVQASLPQWLVGTWTLNDGRMGGKTEMEIAPTGNFTTINYSFSQFGYQPTSRSTQQASYSQNGLQVGGRLYQVTSTSPGTLTLTGNGTTLQLVRAGQQPNNGGPLNNNGNNGNNGQIIQVNNVVSNLPAAMQGTWYEVSLNSRGEQILNRYDLGASGSYEMFQYAISAQGEVDLNSPVARLSQIASAQQRTLQFQNGVLSLGAGQNFAEGPYTVSSNGTTLTLTDSTETRTWTRNP